MSRVNESTGSGYIFINNPKAILNISEKLHNQGEYGKLVCIAYTNSTLDGLNEMIRDNLYNKDKKFTELPQFMPGEFIIAVAPYYCIPKGAEGDDRYRRALLYNNDLFIVKNHK